MTDPGIWNGGGEQRSHRPYGKSIDQSGRSIIWFSANWLISLCTQSTTIFHHHRYMCRLNNKKHHIIYTRPIKLYSLHTLLPGVMEEKWLISVLLINSQLAILTVVRALAYWLQKCHPMWSQAGKPVDNVINVDRHVTVHVQQQGVECTVVQCSHRKSSVFLHRTRSLQFQTRRFLSIVYIT